MSAVSIWLVTLFTLGPDIEGALNPPVSTEIVAATISHGQADFYITGGKDRACIAVQSSASWVFPDNSAEPVQVVRPDGSIWGTNLPLYTFDVGETVYRGPFSARVPLAASSGARLRLTVFYECHSLWLIRHTMTLAYEDFAQ